MFDSIEEAVIVMFVWMTISIGVVVFLVHSFNFSLVTPLLHLTY